MTKTHKMLLDTINTHLTKTKSIYYMLFGEWPKYDCLPEFKKPLWTIIMSIDHGIELCEFLDFSEQNINVQLDTAEDEQCQGFVFYSEDDLDTFEKILETLRVDYRDAIYMMYRLPLGDHIPDYLWAEFTGNLLKVISKKEAALAAQSNLFTICKTGLRHHPMNPITWDLEHWNFSARTYNCLYRAGIRCTVDILAKKWSEIEKIRNLGQKSQDELRAALEKYNLTCKPENIPIRIISKQVAAPTWDI